MFRKTYLLIFITFLLNHCGFTPLYSNKVNNNFSIVDLTMKGDRIINNYIKQGRNGHSPNCTNDWQQCLFWI